VTGNPQPAGQQVGGDVGHRSPCVVGVRPQPVQRAGGTHPELDPHHAGGLLHKRGTYGDRCTPIVVTAGPGVVEEQRPGRGAMIRSARVLGVGQRPAAAR
jgi:hypothetical protein